MVVQQPPEIIPRFSSNAPDESTRDRTSALHATLPPFCPRSHSYQQRLAMTAPCSNCLYAARRRSIPCLLAGRQTYGMRMIQSTAITSGRMHGGYLPLLKNNPAHPDDYRVLELRKRRGRPPWRSAPRSALRDVYGARGTGARLNGREERGTVHRRRPSSSSLQSTKDHACLGNGREPLRRRRRVMYSTHAAIVP
jgi:hypothetical protein